MDGERDGIRALAGEGNRYRHLIVWRYGGGEEQLEVRLDVRGVTGRNSRIVQLDPVAQVNNIQVIHFGRSEELRDVPLKLKAWDIRWIEIE